MEEPKDRISVVEMVYHRPFGDQATVIESRFSRDLQGHEQPYTRNLKATEEWQQLDCGWLPNAGMLVIHNTEGKFLQVNPTDEERKESASKILEVCFDWPDRTGWKKDPTHCWLVLPGESMRGCPSQPRELYIHSQSGVAKYTIHLLPR